MDDRLPIRPDLGFYRKLAKQLKRALVAGDPGAAARFARHHPRLSGETPESLSRRDLPLGDAQQVVAREHGFESWSALRRAVERALADPRNTPADRLMAAIRSGDLESVCERLRSDPALARTPDSDGGLPLIEACERGALPMVDALLAAGADPQRATEHWTPLLAAAHAGPHKSGPAQGVIDRLLEAGAPDDWFTHAALGRVEALQHALPTSDIDARGPLACTALFLASWNGHVEAVRLLLRAGADPNRVCRAGQTAWQSVVQHLWHPAYREIARLLVEHGASCSFHEACQLGHLPTVRRMLAQQPELARQPGPRGIAPAILAVLAADASLAALLLEAGAPDPKEQLRALTRGAAEEQRDLSGTVYRGCSLRLANFHDCTLADAIFSDVNLSGARFDNVNLGGAAIDNAHIRGLTIYGIEVEPLLVAELERRHARGGAGK